MVIDIVRDVTQNFNTHDIDVYYKIVATKIRIDYIEIVITVTRGSETLAVVKGQTSLKDKTTIRGNARLVFKKK